MDTRAQIIKEYTRCVKDPSHAIENYLQTFDLTQNGFVPFNLFEQQRNAIDNYEAARFNILLKYRQAGATTFTAAYLATKGAFSDPTKPEKILIVANKLETAIEFLGKIVDFLKQFPNWVGIAKPDGKFTKESQKHIKLLNGSEYKAVASSPDALRGYVPTYMVLDEAAFIEGGSAFWAACLASISTGGKATLISCATDDTFVYTDKGIKQIKDFITSQDHGYHHINQYNVLGKAHTRSGNIFYNNGLADTLKFSTTYSQIESTPTHRYWAYKIKDQKYNWYRASDLEVGDYLSIQYGKNIWGNNDDCSDFTPTVSNRIHNHFTPSKITADIAYLVGLYISEGSVIKNSSGNKGITITCGDDISGIFNKMGLTYYSKDQLHYEIGSINLTEFLEYLGFDLAKHAPEKIIPSRVLEMGKENISAMVQGIMDGDGHANYQTNKNKLRVGVSSSSKKLIEQLRIILNNFGILTEYREYLTKPTKKVKVRSQEYRLIANNGYAITYFNEIGFRLERKNSIGKLFRQDKIKHSGVFDNIPNGSQIINETYHKNKYRGLLKDLHENGVKISQITAIPDKSIVTPTSRKVLLKMLAIMKIDDVHLNTVIDENIVWTPINEITPSQNLTYDFSLPDDPNDLYEFDHSVIYNGFLTHQTPHGLDEIYYAQYEGSIEGKNTFVITEMKWYLDPRYNANLKFIRTTDIIKWMGMPEIERSEEIVHIPLNGNLQELSEYCAQLISEGYRPHSPWFETMCRSMNFNRRDIAQELEGSFLGSGDNVIDTELIIKQEKENVRPPIRKEWNGDMWIWEDPRADHRYIAGLDVSRGDSDDSTGLVIIDFDSWEQVAEYHGKMPPDVAATLLMRYGIKYNAFTCIDITGGMGIATTRKLTELKFPTKLLFYDGLSELELFGGAPEDAIPGINFSARNNRVQIIAAMEEAIRMGGFKLRSLRLTNEFRKFVYLNGRPDHLKGAHDDLIMSLAMAIFTANVAFARLQKTTAQMEAMSKSWKTYETSHQPIQEQNPAAISNNQHTQHNMPFMPEANPYGTSYGRSAYDQYKWLFGVTPKQVEEFKKTGKVPNN